MKILFLGSGFLGLSLLEELVNLHQSGKVQLVGVFPWSQTKKGKTLKDDGEAKLCQFIQKQRLKIIRCPGANHFEFNQYLQSLKPDVVLVGCWGEILKPHLVQRKDIKFINCHPSKLPAHRGANPYVSAILAKEKESGLTFHWMGVGIDDGPIILQQTIPIADDETGGSLRDKCCVVAKQIVGELIEKLETQTIADATQQVESEVSYYPQITLADGLIHWENSPDDILCRLRALQPWLSCYSMLQGQLLYIFHKIQIVTRQVLQEQYSTIPILESQQIPPGTVVAKSGNIFWIQSSEPERLFQVDDYQFYMGLGFLPKIISRFLSRHMIRVGYRFLHAFVQGVVSQSQ